MRFALALLLLVSMAAFGFDVDKSKPVIYLVNQNPTAPYYGNAAASYIAKKFPSYSVYAYYLNMDFNSNRGTTRFLVEAVVGDIRRVKPAFVILQANGIIPELKQALPDQKIITFGFNPGDNTIVIQNPVERLLQALEAMEYESDKFYILTDSSTVSRQYAAAYEILLAKKNVPKARIETTHISDTRMLEKKLRELNKFPPGVILNLMTEIQDDESSANKYAIDIKRILIRLNKRHIDVGGYLVHEGNESILLRMDYDKIGPFIENIGKDTSKLPPVPIRLYFNTQRLSALGYSKNYVQGISYIDEIIK